MREARRCEARRGEVLSAYRTAGHLRFYTRPHESNEKNRRKTFNKEKRKRDETKGEEAKEEKDAKVEQRN